MTTKLVKNLFTDEERLKTTLKPLRKNVKCYCKEVMTPKFSEERNAEILKQMEEYPKFRGSPEVCKIIKDLINRDEDEDEDEDEDDVSDSDSIITITPYDLKVEQLEQRILAMEIAEAKIVADLTARLEKAEKIEDTVHKILDDKPEKKTAIKTNPHQRTLF